MSLDLVKGYPNRFFSNYTMHVAVIIAAGGLGSRLNSRTPKQFLHVGEMSMLLRSIRTFEGHDLIDEIVKTTFLYFKIS